MLEESLFSSLGEKDIDRVILIRLLILGQFIVNFLFYANI